MKITGYLKSKERIELQLDKISCVYWHEGKYFFIFNEEAIIIEEAITDQVLLKNFLFIPGKRLLPESNQEEASENTFIINDENGIACNYQTDNTKHFINRNNINWFISSKHPSGLNLYKIGVEKYMNDMKINENFYFLISSANISSQMIHYFE